MVKGKIDYVSVYYTKGKKTHKENTSCNPNLTDEAVKNYFKVGRVVNVGRGDKDYFERITKVIIHRKKEKNIFKNILDKSII